jgi:hypothetical protein
VISHDLLLALPRIRQRLRGGHGGWFFDLFLGTYLGDRHFWTFVVLIFFDVGGVHLYGDAIVLVGLHALFALALAILNPGACFFAGHAFEEKGHFDGLGALFTVNSNGVELLADAEWTFMAFVDPGGEAAGVVGVSAECDNIAVVFEADGAAIVDIDEVGVLLVHVIIR